MQVTTELLEEIKAKAAAADLSVRKGRPDIFLEKHPEVLTFRAEMRPVYEHDRDESYYAGERLAVFRPLDGAGGIGLIQFDDDDYHHIARMDPPTALALVEEIERLQADNARMREALKPFADEAIKYDPEEGDDDDLPFGINIVVGDLRRARAALEGK